MFKTSTPVIEPAPVDMAAIDGVISLSELSLDLDPPTTGWNVYLAGRGIEVVTDDIGRSAIGRADAKQLFDELREAEARKSEMRAVVERQAIEADRLWRSQLPHGVSADLIPAGSTFAEAVLSAELDSVGYRPQRATMAEDLFSRDDAMVYHPIVSDEE
jgi:hypothetical protein